MVYKIDYLEDVYEWSITSDGTEYERVSGYTPTIYATYDGEETTEAVLIGRAFLTGKSGSGKSNSASVVAEELIERDHAILIVDTDGEYFGLKEHYELFHAGADDECDIQVGPEQAGKLAEFALEQNVPLILGVSGYLKSALLSTYVPGPWFV
ncbi:helicase HerA domain-containing protein [Natronorarus salvus]|uniref:helicase HerA domain-containing protein n=1 Tax=Natronorarus salvus TaxID=3117733 RepID=UPI003907EAAA